MPTNAQVEAAWSHFNRLKSKYQEHSGDIHLLLPLLHDITDAAKTLADLYIARSEYLKIPVLTDFVTKMEAEIADFYVRNPGFKASDQHPETPTSSRPESTPSQDKSKTTETATSDVPVTPKSADSKPTKPKKTTPKKTAPTEKSEFPVIYPDDPVKQKAFEMGLIKPEFPVIYPNDPVKQKAFEMGLVGPPDSHVV